MSMEILPGGPLAPAAPARGGGRCGRAARAVSAMLQVPVPDIMGRARGARVSRARQIAMYVANVVFGAGMAECGREFGRDRSTVSYACSRIEDERDDPALDERLDALERAIRAEEAAHED
jgi:chromosomal replication initiation ATPase DnaA